MVQERLAGDSLVIDLGRVLDVASSLHGIAKARYIVINYVDKDFNLSDPVEYAARVSRSLGLEASETLVFFTAVEKGRYVKAKDGGVSVYATIGLRPPVCIDYGEVYEAPSAGTINVIVIVESGELSTAGLLDLFRVVAEAKCLAASFLGLRCRSRSPGTVTDAVAVAARLGSSGARWAGMATRLGNTVARLVHRVVVEGDDRGLGERLRGFLGLGLQELVEEAMRLYRLAPVPGVSEELARERIEELLRKALGDPNTWSFIIAARELDLYGVEGLIPGVSRQEFLADTRRIVADEALEAALANYLAGFRGLLAAYWVDREKKRLGLRIADLPVFEDDVAAALIGSVLSRLYDELLGTGI